ncbi:hypothetical protein [Escherichia coli]|uniref:hypothetical protein n=1 Tax=Escherichia coli TaxID=562 RepID=UPI00207BA978|nr:hypothetical protein [Escherichia coli]
MNGFRNIHGTVSLCWQRPEAGPLFWSQWTLDGSAEGWRRAACVRPGQTAAVCPKKAEHCHRPPGKV